MEWLDVVDEKGNPTGERVERKEAHRRGIRHRTSHVWILREQEGEVQVLLQKRSQGKDSHPGCYDISSAGHIPAGKNGFPQHEENFWRNWGSGLRKKNSVSGEQEPFTGKKCFTGSFLWITR